MSRHSTLESSFHRPLSDCPAEGVVRTSLQSQEFPAQFEAQKTLRSSGSHDTRERPGYAEADGRTGVTL